MATINRLSLTGLRMLHGCKTLLVITHQFDAIRNADRIVVLDNHRIVEQGTHAQLLAAEGRYAAFWRARSASAGWRLQRFEQDTASDRSRYAPVS
jgi:ATP-binding cassette subfamily B protein IrtB